MEVTVVAQWLAVPSVASWTPNPFRHRHRYTGLVEESGFQ
jgi:hypothetical protein